MQINTIQQFYPFVAIIHWQKPHQSIHCYDSTLLDQAQVAIATYYYSYVILPWDLKRKLALLKLSYSSY